jgi:hypothetical protein
VASGLQRVPSAASEPFAGRYAYCPLMLLSEPLWGIANHADHLGQERCSLHQRGSCDHPLLLGCAQRSRPFLPPPSVQRSIFPFLLFVSLSCQSTPKHSPATRSAPGLSLIIKSTAGCFRPGVGHRARAAATISCCLVNSAMKRDHISNGILRGCCPLVLFENLKKEGEKKTRTSHTSPNRLEKLLENEEVCGMRGGGWGERRKRGGGMKVRVESRTGKHCFPVVDHKEY